eukprot:scaffold16441_cov31-Prasinocladus_malaysianus.AAC.1
MNHQLTGRLTGCLPACQPWADITWVSAGLVAGLGVHGRQDPAVFPAQAGLHPLSGPCTRGHGGQRGVDGHGAGVEVHGVPPRGRHRPPRHQATQHRPGREGQAVPPHRPRSGRRPTHRHQLQPGRVHPRLQLLRPGDVCPAHQQRGPCGPGQSTLSCKLRVLLVPSSLW